nr:hypothetical protein [Tanacetum cinerariifolium]
MLRDNALVELRKKFEKAKQERDELKFKLEKFHTSSKNLSKLLASQITDKTGLGYDNQVFNSTVFDCDKLIRSESDVSMPTSPVHDKTFVKPVEHHTPAEHLKKDIPKSRVHKHRWNRKAFFVCKSLNHLIKDFDYYEKTIVQKPVRNHAMKRTHQHYARMTHSHPNRHVVPTAILTGSRLVPLTAARPVTTAVPQTNVTHQRPTKHVVNQPHLPIRRPINHRPSPKYSNFHQKVTTVKANQVNDVQDDKGVIDSGCSRHMTGNISYLSDFEELNGGYVAFGGNPKGGDGYHHVPPPYTGTFLPHKPDLVFHDALTTSKTVPTVLNVKPKDESEGEPMSIQKAPSFVQTSEHVKTPRSSAKPVEHPIPAKNLRTDIPKSRVLTSSRLVPLTAARHVTTVVPQTKVQHQRLTKHGVNKAYSPIRRPINHIPSFKNSNFHQKVTTVKANKGNVVQGVKGNWENQPNVVGSVPIWLFDIDTLTQSMNYQPVVVGNQPNFSADMPALEDITYSDDEEDVGVEADFSNLETNIAVEPKRIHQALKDPSWINAMQGELLQFKMQKGDTQKESIDYEEVFASVARIEAIRTIEEEVYVSQPPGFKTLIILIRGKIDQTLFIKKQKGDILLVQ